MNSDGLAQLVYDLSFTAGMNQQYFQTMEALWSSRDWWLRVIVTAAAFASLIATCVGEYQKKTRAEQPDAPPKWKARLAWLAWPSISWGLKLSVVSAAVALLMSGIPAADNARQYGAFYRQWTLFRQQADELLFDLDALDSDDQSVTCGDERYRRLLAMRAQIESLEPAPDEKLLEQCAQAESERRHGKGVKTFEQRKKAVEEQAAVSMRPVPGISVTSQ